VTAPRGPERRNEARSAAMPREQGADPATKRRKPMTEANLQQKTCVPCRGGVEPLSASEVTALLSQVPGWEARDGHSKIAAGFRFKNFRAALDFVHDLGELAEAEFHHPESVTFGWGFAKVVLQTKKIKGLHENDFIMAAKINDIAERCGAEAAQ
jgi:4a-hydroxytetrahydrobiopterin dehydratase